MSYSRRYCALGTCVRVYKYLTVIVIYIVNLLIYCNTILMYPMDNYLLLCDRRNNITEYKSSLLVEVIQIRYVDKLILQRRSVSNSKSKLN